MKLPSLILLTSLLPFPAGPAMAQSADAVLQQRVIQLENRVATLEATIKRLENITSAAVGKTQSSPAKTSAANPLAKGGNATSGTELEGRWLMFSATYQTISGSSYTFAGDRVSIVTKRPVGSDKTNYKIESDVANGKFQLSRTSTGKSINIILDDGTSYSMEYSLSNGELWIWPVGNKFSSTGFRRARW